MRDLIAELEGTIPAGRQSGKRDLIAEMGGVIPPEPIKESSFWDRVTPYLSDIGAATVEDARGQGSAGRAALATAGSLAIAPVAGIAGLSKTITSGIDEGGKTLEEISSLPGRLVTPAESPLMETADLAMKPFRMAGEGLQEIVRLTPAKDTIAEPIAGAIGEISAMFGLPGVPKSAKSWWNNLPYRKRVMVVEQVQADIANGEFTGAELRELWKDPANREALLKRYQGVGQETATPTGKGTIRASGADARIGLPPGQGFELRPRPSEIRDIIAEMGAEGTKALPAGQGFEIGSAGARDIIAEMGEPGPKALPYPEGIGDDFTFSPAEAEAPIVTKAGDPFKTEKSATQAGKGLDWNLYEVTPQGDGFAITRKQGQEIRTPNPPPIRETERLRAQLDAEDAARRNGTFTPPAEVPAARAPSPQAEIAPVETGNVSSGSEIVQPGANSKKGPQNLITYLEKQGGVNWDPSYDSRIMRQYPDGKRVSRTTGQAPDVAAEMLNGEGWVGPDGKPFTADSLAEIVKSGNARNVFTPDKMDDIWERKIRKEEAEYYADIEAGLAEEALDASAGEGKKSIKSLALDEIAAEEGLSESELAFAMRDADDIFSAVAQKTPTKESFIGKKDTGAISGIPKDFNLVNPETEIARGPLSKKDMTPTGDLIGSQRGSIPINESEVLNSILKTRGKIADAMPHLETLGRSVYEGGKQKFLEWQATMKGKLGELWEGFKGHLRAIYDRLQSGEVGPLGNQKGAVGVDINKGPIVKQREIKDAKTKEVRFAPEVYESEFNAVKKMPELRQKPLGGWLENPIRTFEELGPEIKELFYRPVKEAEHLANKHFQKIHEKAETIRKSLPGKSSERIGIYAIAQQKGGAEILAGMKITEIPKLTPAELKAYNWMRTGLETFYEKLQEARAKAGKEGFGHVENYFTFARQFALLEKLGFSPIFSRMELLQNVIHRKTTPFQYEKHRVGGLSRADLDAFGVFNRYMFSATRHYYLSPAIAKGREMGLTFHEGEAKWILRDEKPAAAKFITEWLDFVAGQRKPQLPNLIEKGLTKLNKNLAFSILSANIRSALIQPTALVNTVTELGPKWTFEGLKSILDNSGIEKSNVLLSRQFDVNVTESLAGLPGKLGKARQAVGNVGMKPLQFLDMQTAKATWNGAYRKGLSEKMPETAARNYADDVVTKTQGSARPSDLSPAQRTALGKSLTMFQTFVINQWGFLTRDVLGIKNASVKNPQMVKKVATFILAATAVNSFYEDVVGVPSPLPSPISAFVKAIEKGESIPSASLDAATEIASLVPIVGGGLRYGSSILGAPAEFAGDITKKLAPNYVGPTRSTAELVAKGTGIPGTAQLVKSLKIANKGGSPVDVVLGRYPEEVKLIQPKTLKGNLKRLK